jgi:hypothetical protein
MVPLTHGLCGRRLFLQIANPDIVIQSFSAAIAFAAGCLVCIIATIPLSSN